MRYPMQITTADGVKRPIAYQEVSPDDNDGIAELLGRRSMRRVVQFFDDGSHLSNGPLEYECEWCGEYGHSIEGCLSFAETDDPVSPDDRIDESIGGSNEGDPN